MAESTGRWVSKASISAMGNPMTSDLFYSCAYFEDEIQTLEEAQLAKCRLIMKKLLLLLTLAVG